MGEVASVIKALPFDACAKTLCNGLSMHSQCCDSEDGCNCDTSTVATKTDTIEGDVEIEMENDCEGLCCNCIMRAHK